MVNPNPYKVDYGTTLDGFWWATVSDDQGVFARVGDYFGSRDAIQAAHEMGQIGRAGLEEGRRRREEYDKKIEAMYGEFILP
jgi:hypothetical protein